MIGEDVLPGRRSITSEQLQWLADLASRTDLGSRLLHEIAPELRSHAWLNRLTPDAWQRAVRDTSTDTLARLIRLFTLAEKEFSWSGGSAAAVIWLYRLLAERDPARAQPLADWVFANRGGNDYVPFGSRTTAKTYDEYLVEQRSREIQRRARLELVEEQSRVAAEGRHLDAEAHEVRRRAGQSRSARRRWQIEFLQLQPGGISLSDAVRQWPLPLDAFPLDLLPDLDAAAAVLNRETRDILTMMIGRRGGVWRQLRRKLERLNDHERHSPGLH